MLVAVPVIAVKTCLFTAFLCARSYNIIRLVGLGVVVGVVGFLAVISGNIVGFMLILHKSLTHEKMIDDMTNEAYST